MTAQRLINVQHPAHLVPQQGNSGMVAVSVSFIGLQITNDYGDQLIGQLYRAAPTRSAVVFDI